MENLVRTGAGPTSEAAVSDPSRNLLGHLSDPSCRRGPVRAAADEPRGGQLPPRQHHAPRLRPPPAPPGRARHDRRGWPRRAERSREGYPVRAVEGRVSPNLRALPPRPLPASSPPPGQVPAGSALFLPAYWFHQVERSPEMSREHPRSAEMRCPRLLAAPGGELCRSRRAQRRRQLLVPGPLARHPPLPHAAPDARHRPPLLLDAGVCEIPICFLSPRIPARPAGVRRAMLLSLSARVSSFFRNAARERLCQLHAARGAGTAAPVPKLGLAGGRGMRGTSGEAGCPPVSSPHLCITDLFFSRPCFFSDRDRRRRDGLLV